MRCMGYLWTSGLAEAEIGRFVGKLILRVVLYQKRDSS